MRHLRPAIVTAAFFLAMGLNTRTCLQAQDFGWGYPPAWYPYWLGATAYRIDPVPTPPYFAVHPPVYYGQRVTMVYGDSPITHPPLTAYRLRQEPCNSYAPPIAEPPPVGQWIENPFVTNTAPQQEPVEETREVIPSDAGTPVMIENAYFVSGRKLAVKP